MKNITASQLAAQYERARDIAGDVIDRAERDHGLPRLILYALGSRETNLDPHWLDHPGDGGHGHGWWQIDDRYHAIPPDWSTNIAWQANRGAEILAGNLARFDGDLLSALNAYNSGSPRTEYTTGRDYGPDVLERHAFLTARYPAPPPAPAPKEPDMFLFTDPRDSRVYLRLSGGTNDYVEGKQDLDAMQSMGIPGPYTMSKEYAEQVVTESDRQK